jgi:group I intron endonuclease
MVGIYKITSPSGKVYIGESLNILKRWSQYENGHVNKQWKLARSIRKYGWKLHKVEIIECCEPSLLRERERYWQLHYNSVAEGLNLKLTGIGEIKTQESVEVSQNRSKAQMGRKHTEETKQKLSQIRKGVAKPEGFGDSIRERFKGKRLSEDHALKISKSKEKPCMIDGALYESCKKASLDLGIPMATLFYRLKSKKYTNCCFV